MTPNTDITYRRSSPTTDTPGAIIDSSSIAQNNRNLAGLIDSLLFSIPDIIFYKDVNGVYLGCNPLFAEFVGRPREEIVGRTDFDLFDRTVAENFRANDQSMLKSGKPRHNDEWITYPDGRKILIDTLKTPYWSQNGTLIGVLGISRDITAGKRSEEALRESESNFQTFFETITDMILVSTPEGRVLFANAAITRTLGYTADEIRGMHVLDVHPADKRLEAEAVFGAMLRGERENCQLSLACKDGSLVPVDTRVWFGKWSGADCLFSISKNLTGVQEAVTKRKRAESELARLSLIQRELMHLATHFVNVPTERQDAAIDESLATMGQLIEADRAYLFAYDFAADTMSNTHEWCAYGIAPEIDNLQAVPNALLPDWVEAHRHGKSTHIPSVMALPNDGFLRQMLEPQGIHSLITLPLMQGQSCLGFVGFDAVRAERVWRDEEVALLRVLAELFANFEARRANEREARKLQENLILARDAAQAAAMAKSMFLSNMSHEIRTPLNAVLGYAQIMQRECQMCTTSVRLNAITRSGEHLLGLLTDLLELGRSDACATTLAPCDFDFYQVLEDLRLMFERHAQAQGLTLELVLAPDVPQFIHADSGKVRQILVNIVGNAFKFTDKGGVRVSASVVSGDAAAEITLAVAVEDTGCGIGDDELESVFDIFVQAQPGRQSGKGAGLGLPLSRRYARALGGDVSVTSRPDEGSHFRFTFRARVISGSVAQRPKLGNVRRLAPDQPACHLLIVDDETENRDMLVEMLTSVGFTVETAAHAAQALHRMSQAAGVNLVLMDKRLPEMDGYEAMRRMRQLAGWREVPVLVVTASGLADEKDLALSAGANGYIAKPVRREPLLAEIARLAGVRYEHDAAEPDPVTPALLNATTLACLSPEQLRLFKQAVLRGDTQTSRQLLAQIATTHADVAAGLGLLVDAYDYKRLRRLLDSAPGNIL